MNDYDRDDDTPLVARVRRLEREQDTQRIELAKTNVALAALIASNAKIGEDIRWAVKLVLGAVILAMVSAVLIKSVDRSAAGTAPTSSPRPHFSSP